MRSVGAGHNKESITPHPGAPCGGSMRPRLIGATRTALVALIAIGCVEPNHGSRIIANFQSLGPASAVQGAGILVSPHYEMWATIRLDSVVELFGFEVQPVVDPSSPCLFYDDVAHQAYGYVQP